MFTRCVSQRQRRDMFIETPPTKIASSVWSEIFPSRHPIMPLLTELDWFGDSETINMSALTGFLVASAFIRFRCARGRLSLIQPL